LSYGAERVLRAFPFGPCSKWFMTSELERTKTELTTRSVFNQLRGHGWTIRTGGAACGLCGGIGVALLGSFITAVAWFIGPEWHGHLLQRDGTILLFLTIPLLTFGAHCLDLIDKKTQVSARKGKNDDLETDKECS